MSEFKGTKGKWQIDVDCPTSVISKSETEQIDGNIICDAPVGWDLSMENWEANAKLISCAPEMLEVLKGLVSDVDGLLSEYDIEWQQAGYLETARALIQKATL